MSESWKEVLDALPDEEDRMAVLIGVVRFEKNKEKILELLRYSIEISARACLARELMERGTFTERRRQHEASNLKLPFDILSEIVLVFSRVQENGAWPFSGVCRAWREAALSTPRAWTNIYLRATYSAACHHQSYAVPRCTCISRMPDPALCIKRVGIWPIHLELQELLTTTSNPNNFIFHIIPHVQSLHIHTSTGSEVRINARSVPKLKELVIMRSPCTTNIPDEDLQPSSILLYHLLGPATYEESTPTLSRLQVARFDEVMWQGHHLAAFKQLCALTLIECGCGLVDELHDLLRNNCTTLEYLHLSVSPVIMSESQEFQPVRLPKLRKLSFLVACYVSNPLISYQDPMLSHATSFFQSLVIPRVTELQVFAPCIQDLDLRTRCPSLRHFHLIIPENMNEIRPYVQGFYSLLTTTPLHTIDLFISQHRGVYGALPEVEYNIAMALEAFLDHPFVLEHPILASFTLKSRLDFEPLHEHVRRGWTRAAKRLHISKATMEEWENGGFKILQDAA